MNPYSLNSMAYTVYQLAERLQVSGLLSEQLRDSAWEVCKLFGRLDSLGMPDRKEVEVFDRYDKQMQEGLHWAILIGDRQDQVRAEQALYLLERMRNWLH